MREGGLHWSPTSLIKRLITDLLDEFTDQLSLNCLGVPHCWDFVAWMGASVVQALRSLFEGAFFCVAGTLLVLLLVTLASWPSAACSEAVSFACLDESGVNVFALYLREFVWCNLLESKSFFGVA